jgi:Flp pilus assembly protein TadB
VIAALLGGLWARFSGWLVAAGAAIAAIGAVYLAGARSARHAARSKELEQALERREVRDAADRDVAREPDAAGRLQRDWRRD